MRSGGIFHLWLYVDAQKLSGSGALQRCSIYSSERVEMLNL
jgi:hypothetical protein